MPNWWELRLIQKKKKEKKRKKKQKEKKTRQIQTSETNKTNISERRGNQNKQHYKWSGQTRSHLFNQFCLNFTKLVCLRHLSLPQSIPFLSIEPQVCEIELIFLIDFASSLWDQCLFFIHVASASRFRKQFFVPPPWKKGSRRKTLKKRKQ